jgi:hypothetical protein
MPERRRRSPPQGLCSDRSQFSRALGCASIPRYPLRLVSRCSSLAATPRSALGANTH